MKRGTKDTPIVLDADVAQRMEKAISDMVNPSDSPTVSGIRIRKVVITNHRTLKLTYEEVKTDGSFDVINRDCQQLIHEDLYNAFGNLVPHYIILCDLREILISGKTKLVDPEDYEMEKFDHIKVLSFSLTGNEDTEAVVLSGTKFFNEKTLNINTPSIKFTDTYQFIEELSMVIENIKDEVKLYLNGKCIFKQMSIGFEEDQNEGSGTSEE